MQPAPRQHIKGANQQAARRSKKHALSPEERRALTLLSRPRTKNEVCEEMRISREALREIMVSVTDKLGVGSVLEAIAKFTTP